MQTLNTKMKEFQSQETMAFFSAGRLLNACDSRTVEQDKENEL